MVPGERTEEGGAPPLGGEPQRVLSVASLLRTATPRAWVTPGIAALLVACFAGEVALGVDPLNPTTGELLRAGAGFGPALLEGQWWRLFSATLLHGGVVHLAFNLWAFLSVGQFTERIFGNLAFATLYLLSALGGSLLSTAVHPLSVSVGASGAIFGVYGALLAFALTHRGVFPPELLRRQRNSLVGFLVYNVAFSFAVPSIDVAGHAGGLVTGLAAGWLLRRDLLRPAESVRRRVWGAGALVSLLLLGTLGVRARVERLPEVRARALAQQALSALQASNARRASELYTAALALREDASSLHNRALARLELDETEGALQDLSRALALAPGDPRTLGLRAVVLLQLGHLDEAERDCADLWKAPGFDPVSARFCADVARRRGDPRTALDRLGRVLEKAPDDRKALLFRSMIRDEADDVDGALADLDHALRLEPDDASALNDRAWLRIERGDFAGGRRDAERSLELAPDEPTTLGTRCFALAGLGEREAAGRDCARAVALDPDDAIDQGMIAFLDGRRAEAVSRWAEAGEGRAATARALRPWVAKARGH